MYHMIIHVVMFITHTIGNNYIISIILKELEVNLTQEISSYVVAVWTHPGPSSGQPSFALVYGYTPHSV